MGHLYRKVKDSFGKWCMLNVCWMCVGCVLDVCWMCVGCGLDVVGGVRCGVKRMTATRGERGRP